MPPRPPLLVHAFESTCLPLRCYLTSDTASAWLRTRPCTTVVACGSPSAPSAGGAAGARSLKRLGASQRAESVEA